MTTLLSMSCFNVTQRNRVTQAAERSNAALKLPVRLADARWPAL